MHDPAAPTPHAPLDHTTDTAADAVDPSAPTGPLAGVRIADLTTVVMGPMATRILGDLGADVIKIEAPVVDFMRDFDPKRSPGMGAMSLNLQRNKRSIVLDLKSEAGHRAVLDVIASCDVFISNMRPAALAPRARLRLGRRPQVRHHLLRRHRLRQLRPLRRQGGLRRCDPGCVRHGVHGGVDGRGPAYVPTIAADKISGLHIVYAVLAALYRKAMTGHGDAIEVPMAESVASFNLVEHLNGHTLEPKEPPFSYQRLLTPHRRPRRSADGWVCILPYSDQNWRDFFALVGEPELADDPRFASVNSRVANVDPLYELLDTFMAQHTTEEWMQLCDAASIPAVPVVDLEHIDDDPHFAQVGMIELHEHPTEGAYRVVRDPVASPPAIRACGAIARCQVRVPPRSSPSSATTTTRSPPSSRRAPGTLTRATRSRNTCRQPTPNSRRTSGLAYG
ncbi:MAG: CoA transferase [Acidimicrobiales bacterium]